MTGIIEGVEKMLKNYNSAFTNPVTPPEEKEMLRMSLELLNIADFYEINREITSHVHKLNE